MINFLKKIACFKSLESDNVDTIDDSAQILIRNLLYFLVIILVIAMINVLIFNNNANGLMYTLFLLVGNFGLCTSIIWRRMKLIFNQNSILHGFPISSVFLFFMLIWGMLSAIFNMFELNVWLGEEYRHEGFFTYLSYAGIYGVSVILYKEQYRKQLLYSFISVSIIISLLTILEFNGFSIPFFASDKSGYSAIFHQFNHFGYYLLMSGMCAAGLFVVDKNRWCKWFSISSFSIIIVTLIINDTFGCYLAMIAGLVFLPFVFILVNQNLKFKYFLPLLLFVILTLGMNLITGTVESNMNTLSTDITKIVKQDESSGSAGTGRWVLWINAVEFIKEKPLFGHGLDNLGKLYYPLGVGTDRPHNEYLQHAAHLGIPALIFYLCSLASTFINAFKHRRNLSSTTLVSLCVVAAYLISACFGNTMYYTTPYFVMFLGMSTKIGKSDSLEEEIEK